MLEGPTVGLIGKLSNAIGKSDQRIVFSSSSPLRYCTFEGRDWKKPDKLVVYITRGFMNMVSH